MIHLAYPLFWMLVFHALADYPLQGDYLAKFKNPWLHPDERAKMPPGTVPPWWIAMSAHCLIHAGGVALATGDVGLGLVEFLMHFWTDYGKCAKFIGFKADQLLHVGFKLFYLGLMFWPTPV